MQRKELDVEIVALMGSAHHQNRMREVLETYSVDTVYHAAAYKHVPLVEHNMIEGIHNNVVRHAAYRGGRDRGGRRVLRAGLDRQGRAADQRHGRHEALRGARAPEPESAQLEHEVLDGSIRQRPGFVRTPSCRCSASRSAMAAL